MTPERRRFSGRGFVAQLLFLAFMMMTASGTVMFAAPSGRIARETGWHLFGLDRASWLTLHLGFALTFLLVGLLHLVFNGHAMLHYLRDRRSHRLTMRWESLGALAVAGWLVASVVFGWPPATTLHDWSRELRLTPPADYALPADVPQATSAPVDVENAELPPRHPPTEPGQACSYCHRR
jgi:hypothetical protein